MTSPISHKAPTHCSHCREPWSRHDPESTSYCSNCNNFMLHYTPLPHQIRFHADKVKYKMFAGGKKSRSPL